MQFAAEIANRLDTDWSSLSVVIQVGLFCCSMSGSMALAFRSPASVMYGHIRAAVHTLTLPRDGIFQGSTALLSASQRMGANVFAGQHWHMLTIDHMQCTGIELSACNIAM